MVPHVNTLWYLRTCINQIRKYKHPLIEHKIIIADQSDEPILKQIIDLYGNDPEILILKLPRIDAGYPIDVGLKYTNTEYFCSLDCDAFPIHHNWLYLPIKLIEKYNYSFVGSWTGLENSYKHKGNFFHINNYYRVSKTSLAREISEAVGFMRPQNRWKVGFIPKDNSWGNEGCDNGVVAQWYCDQKKLGSKLSLRINKYLGTTPKMGIYGMVIDDLVFHMVFGFAEDWITDIENTLGKAYLELKEKIILKGFISDDQIKELISHALQTSKPLNDRLINGEKINNEVNFLIDKIKIGGAE